MRVTGCKTLEAVLLAVGALCVLWKMLQRSYNHCSIIFSIISRGLIQKREAAACAQFKVEGIKIMAFCPFV